MITNHVFGSRVTPVLKSEEAAGKAKVTAIVNTHQYVRIRSLIELREQPDSHWDHAGGNDEIVRRHCSLII